MTEEMELKVGSAPEQMFMPIRSTVSPKLDNSLRKNSFSLSCEKRFSAAMSGFRREKPIHDKKKLCEWFELQSALKATECYLTGLLLQTSFFCFETIFVFLGPRSCVAAQNK
jgi:hypothetical protein